MVEPEKYQSDRVSEHLGVTVRTFVTNDDRVAKFVADNATHDSSNCGTIGIEDDGQIIAGVLYDDCNGANVCMHVAAKPGVNWLTRDFLKLNFGFAFDGLGVRRVTALVPESNHRSTRFCIHLGFTLEARLRDACPDGDMLVLVMHRRDCRFVVQPDVPAFSFSAVTRRYLEALNHG